ncbi:MULTISPECIES: QueT transporter family protein [Carnobacterium]|uniref:QueT transporter family protein n=1 Tax=Carnobacterium divergens TaxID=2748 RepID=A0A2R7ZVM2_CARDV|nr:MULTISPECIES: QueT transporter family protein [Carnobacterium]MCO6018618.1 QueT transporter family protein [Carnobacterium divergens]MDT1940786.1 QueT transporter family protein [Carnobacterium divergens]MDT1943225.1 QueT transporter family protein [Carnobacterium divergens]MDT1949031.1 QueT transporter family protein [Carnobacterium divergens]MDT1951515.1 QueT transporter family protein [Carnobacterium divergens]
MKTKTLVTNAIVAALYVAVTAVLAPLSFGAVQLRFAEMFNHLVVFNKKYIIGIVAGVFISNLFFSSLGVYDLVFGVGQSLLALLITSGLIRKINNVWIKMTINTIIFSLTMAIIAWELVLVFGLPFWATYLTTGIGEMIVLVLTMPVMKVLNDYLDFNRRIEK